MKSRGLVGAPLSTVYSIINDLVEKNLLARTPEGAIWLGSRLYGYGLTYASSLDYLAVAHEEMNRLSTQVGETVQVCGLEEGMMVVLQMAEGPGHFRRDFARGKQGAAQLDCVGTIAGGTSAGRRTGRLF